jgi:hypothetical protein
MDFDVNTVRTLLLGRLRWLLGGASETQATADVEPKEQETPAADGKGSGDYTPDEEMPAESPEETTATDAASATSESDQTRDTPSSAYKRARTPRSSSDGDSTPTRSSRKRARAPRGGTDSSGEDGGDPTDPQLASEQTSGKAREVSLGIADEETS